MFGPEIYYITGELETTENQRAMQMTFEMKIMSIHIRGYSKEKNFDGRAWNNQKSTLMRVVPDQSPTGTLRRLNAQRRDDVIKQEMCALLKFD